MSRDRTTVSDLGELGLIRRVLQITADPAQPFPADDAAVLQAPGPQLFATDMLVEGVDFDFSYCSGLDAGHKALAANVSDAAAMGGRATHAVAALGVPPGCPLELVEGVAMGLRDAAESWGVALVGGDVSRAPVLVLSVAMLGVAESPVGRSGAAVEDLICVTGTLGGAAGGLALLRREPRPGGRPEVERLVARQLRPQPRVMEGPLIAASGASAMIDVSDGFLADLAHLLDASGVGCEVDLGALPVDPDVASVAETSVGFDPLAAALAGGEDFELLFTIPRQRLPRLRESLARVGGSATVVGETTSGPRRVGGRLLEEWEEKGWDHLRNP